MTGGRGQVECDWRPEACVKNVTRSRKLAVRNELIGQADRVVQGLDRRFKKGVSLIGEEFWCLP